MTEKEVREVLRQGDQDGFEGWIARQIWLRRDGGGWRVAGSLNGWRFTVDVVPHGVQVSAFPPGPRPRPAVWVVTGR
jgi:hypothetical protein